jgi:hypothetical protein
MRLGWNSFRSLAQLSLVSFLVLMVGCGSSFRVSGTLNVPTTSVVSGTVSFVQFTAIFNNSGTLVNVTIVTLATPAVSNTLTLCGNQASQFTMNTAVQVSFTPGSPSCSNLVSVAPGKL